MVEWNGMVALWTVEAVFGYGLTVNEFDGGREVVEVVVASSRCLKLCR